MSPEQQLDLGVSLFILGLIVFVIGLRIELMKPRARHARRRLHRRPR